LKNAFIEVGRRLNKTRKENKTKMVRKKKNSTELKN